MEGDDISYQGIYLYEGEFFLFCEVLWLRGTEKDPIHACLLGKSGATFIANVEGAVEGMKEKKRGREYSGYGRN